MLIVLTLLTVLENVLIPSGQLVVQTRKKVKFCFWHGNSYWAQMAIPDDVARQFPRHRFRFTKNLGTADPTEAEAKAFLAVKLWKADISAARKGQNIDLLLDGIRAHEQVKTFNAMAANPAHASVIRNERFDALFKTEVAVRVLREFGIANTELNRQKVVVALADGVNLGEENLRYRIAPPPPPPRP
jgi:hypothetical protein